MMDCLADRLIQINERITGACERAGRLRESVRLVAVSKRHPPESVADALECGLTLFGESRVQEAAAKIPLCSDQAQWHFIGHLQRNKVAKAIDLFSMIHAVDSVRLLDTINQMCTNKGRVMPVCIEINITGEITKGGITPEELPALLEHSNGLHQVDIIGLMTMARYAENTEDARPTFRALRELSDRCDSEWGYPLPELSMGMSHDFEVAIEEGATYIRVGTDLFGKRNYK